MNCLFLYLIMEIAVLVITGIIGGFLAGLLGLGGGIFYILVLPLAMTWYGIPATEAAPFIVANSLIGIAFASGISVITEFKKLKIYFKEIIFIGISAVIISLLTTKYIVYSPWFSKTIFNIFIIIIMIFVLIKMIYQRKIKSTESSDEKIPPIKGSLSGSISGFISAASGLGGGIIIIPILQIKLKQSIQKSKIISLATIFIGSTFISIQNLLSTPHIPLIDLNNLGYIIPDISLPLILGVIMGGPLGVKISNRMQDQLLNSIFSVIIIIVLIEKIAGLFL